MGGNIHVTFRDTDGTLYYMERWTNPLPHFIKNVLTTNDIESVVQEWMQSYNGMKADYEANRDTGNYQYPMTECYFPEPQDTEFSEYGVVYLDIPNRILIADNHYSGMNVVMGIEIKLEPNDSSEILLKATKLDALYYIPDISRGIYEPEKVTSVEFLYNLIHKIFKGGEKHMADMFEICPPGWYTDTKPTDGEDINNFKARIRKALKAQGVTT